MAQNALSVVTRIKTGETDALETLLDKIGGDVQHNTLVPFPKLQTLHFACWVVLKRDLNFPPCLVLECNFDGELDAHLNEFVACAPEGLRQIYAHCEGFPADAATNPARIKQYLLEHRVPDAAFYIGCYGQSLPAIQSALAARQSIETYLDGEQASGQKLRGLAPTQIYERIKAYFKEHPVAPPFHSAQTYSSLVTRSKLNMAIAVVVGILLLPLLLLFLLWYVPTLRKYEHHDDTTPGPPLGGVDPRLFGKEDIWVQNHLTTLTNIKPGKFRLNTLKGVLWIINLLAKTVFITGQLGGIPTIHFARWLLIDNDRRLLFFSNYDGSWASYLGDFVDKANYGLTSVWSNTDNFPTTRFLFFGGAQHIEEFKAWSRRGNEYAAVWYSAYPYASVRNITQAVQISETLNGSPNEAEIKEWLKKL